ncbi:MAG: hypothetical protein PHC75_06115 [Burkholderiales bacterium]|nr:hypothetical protein [Burkholderiales bacterium]
MKEIILIKSIYKKRKQSLESDLNKLKSSIADCEKEIKDLLNLLNINKIDKANYIKDYYVNLASGVIITKQLLATFKQQKKMFDDEHEQITKKHEDMQSTLHEISQNLEQINIQLREINIKQEKFDYVSEIL